MKYRDVCKAVKEVEREARALGVTDPTSIAKQIANSGNERDKRLFLAGVLYGAKKARQNIDQLTQK